MRIVDFFECSQVFKLHVAVNAPRRPVDLLLAPGVHTLVSATSGRLIVLSEERGVEVSANTSIALVAPELDEPPRQVSGHSVVLQADGLPETERPAKDMAIQSSPTSESDVHLRESTSERGHPPSTVTSSSSQHQREDVLLSCCFLLFSQNLLLADHHQNCSMIYPNCD